MYTCKTVLPISDLHVGFARDEERRPFEIERDDVTLSRVNRPLVFSRVSYVDPRSFDRNTLPNLEQSNDAEALALL